MIYKTNTETLITQLTKLQQHFEAIVSKYLPNPEQDYTLLHAAMNYAVQNGGKRLRPILVYFTGELLGLEQNILDPIAVSVELIHAYSLIHDDLPAMDNSDLRRGKPTCHLAFDEATAILAGDCLQTLAFEILIKDSPNISDAQRIKMLTILAKVSGYQGMGGGQAQDLFFTGKTPNQEQLEQLYRLKTGALIQAAITLPMQIAELSTPKQQALQEFGDWIGLLFQVQDDILDYKTDTQSLGKPQYLDVVNQKHTMINAVGIHRANELVREYAQYALAALARNFTKTKLFNALINYLCTRNT